MEYQQKIFDPCEKQLQHTIVVAPPTEPVALRKTSIKGNPVGEFMASSALPRQNKVAVAIAKPSEPFRATEATMLLGITVDAFSISSAIDALGLVFP